MTLRGSLVTTPESITNLRCRSQFVKLHRIVNSASAYEDNTICDYVYHGQLTNNSAKKVYKKKQIPKNKPFQSYRGFIAKIICLALH